MVTPDTKSKLVEQGMALVLDKGYVGFSYADLAEAAGIRKASIHHHFPAKQDFCLALIRENESRIHKLYSVIEKSSGDGIHKIRQFVAKVFRPLANKKQACLHGILAAEVDALSEDNQNELRKSYELVEDYLARLIQTGIDDGSAISGLEAAEAAVMLAATAQGALQVARVRGMKHFDRITGQAVDFIAVQS